MRIKTLTLAILFCLSSQAYAVNSGNSSNNGAQNVCDEDTQKKINKALENKNKISKKAREIAKKAKPNEFDLEKCLGLSPMGGMLGLPSISGLGDWKKMLCSIAQKPVGKVVSLAKDKLKYSITLGDILPDDIDPAVSEALNDYKGQGVNVGINNQKKWFGGEIKKKKASPALLKSLGGTLSGSLDDYTDERLEEYQE